MLDPLRRRTSGILAAWLATGLAILAIPAAASATTVSIRVEAATGPLVPQTDITLPSAPVAPTNATDVSQTCPGNSVLGAIHTAVGGAWTGTWTDLYGWSLDGVGGILGGGTTGRRWVVYLNAAYLNTPPCQTTLADGDRLIVYPLCTTGFIQCLFGEPLIMAVNAQSSPGVLAAVKVWEITTTFDNLGHGDSQVGPSVGATVYGPNNKATTDSYYGQGYAAINLTERGPNNIYVTKAGKVPDRATVCVTDGNDGFCGSPNQESNPFNPYNYCDTTGNDGLCGTVDQKPPVGHITAPGNAKRFSASAGPRFLKGIADFDPSEVTQVKLRLMRQTTVTVTKYVKRRVTIKRKVKGKVVKKRVVKRKPVKKKVTRCYTWKIATSTWGALKRCDVQLAPFFNADGTEIWSYEFLEALPVGSYTFDAQAVDGKGNTDSAPEAGRNRVTFKVG